MSDHSSAIDRVNYAGMLIAIGSVFGDIGTSPLNTFRAIIDDRSVVEVLALPRMNPLFRKVVEDMVRFQEVTLASRYHSLRQHDVAGDFKFIVINRFLSNEHELNTLETFLMNGYFS